MSFGFKYNILWHLLWVLCIVQEHPTGVLCLRDLKIKVPEAVLRGSSVKLECEYNLEGDVLYSIKWYKDHEEFYRFVPKEAPPSKVFPHPGINVDVSRSDSSAVVLTDVQLELSGYYQCEVSADSPYFHTDIQDAPMIVIDTPDDIPIIGIDKTKYAVGERIRANCTSLSSFPAANLTWQMNGKTVPSSYLRLYEVIVEPNNLETSVLGVEIDTDSTSFREGKLTLRCVATLYNLYRKTKDIVLQEDTPKLASVLGSRDAPAHRDIGCKLKATVHVVVTLSLLLVLCWR